MLRTLLKPVYLSLREILLKGFVHPGPKPVVPNSIKSILVISERRLGDVCLAIPTLQCLRGAYPEAGLGILLPEHLRPLVQWACHPNHFFDYGDEERIAAVSWDLVIDLTTDYHLQPARLASGTRCAVRMGFDFKGRGRYFNLPMDIPARAHMRDIYAQVLEPLQIPFKPSALPSLIPAEPAAEWNRHAVAVHPGAHHPTQRWPAEYFADLIRRIRGGGELSLVLGESQEGELVTDIVKRAGPGATAAITRSVMELAATIRASDVVICNNSGPLHLAGLLGVPTVSFMGPTIKDRWLPSGRHDVVLRRDDLPCIGCNRATCRIRTHACMKEITPEQAYTAYFRLRALLLLESTT